MAGLSGVSRASAKSSASYTQVAEALDSKRVKSLRSALDNPPVRPEKATVQTAVRESRNITVIKLPTTVGRLVYGVTDAGDTTAQFQFKNGARKELPTRYRDLPSPTDAILFGRLESVLLARLATETERRQLISTTGIEADPAETIAFTTSDMDGFALHPINEKQGYTVEVTDAEMTTLSENTLSIQPSDVTVSPLDHNCDQASWCWRCVQSTGACSACYI